MNPAYRFLSQFGRFISLLVCGALLISMFGTTPPSSAKSPRKTKSTAPLVNPQANSQRQRQPAPRDNSRRVDPIQPDRMALPTNLPNVEQLRRRKPEKPEAPAPAPSTVRSKRKRPLNGDRASSNALPAGNGISSPMEASPLTRAEDRSLRSHHARRSATTLSSLASAPASAPLSALPQSPSNVALNKAATQSSTLAYNPPGDASHAVDGNTDGNYFNASVTHTNGGNQDWWQVDLGALYTLQTINVWNRTDCCGDRLSNFYVFVSNDPFSSTDLTTTLNQSGVSNYYTAGQGGTPTTISINRTGRYLRVQLAGSGIMSLAEVEAFGTPAPPPATNVALNKTATQSSTLAYNPPGDASHAVDGNTDGNYFNASVTHTNGGNQDWWLVDLGASYLIQSVEVWNRTDCCGDRLTNFNVILLDANQGVVNTVNFPGQAGTPSTISISGAARYVKVQLVGNNILSLAEVKVWGIPTAPGLVGYWKFDERTPGPQLLILQETEIPERFPSARHGPPAITIQPPISTARTIMSR